MGWASSSRSLHLYTSSGNNLFCDAASVLRLNYRRYNLSVCLHQYWGVADQKRSGDVESPSDGQCRLIAILFCFFFISHIGGWFPLQMADSLLSDGIKESVTCMQKCWGSVGDKFSELNIIHLSIMRKMMLDLSRVCSAAEYLIIYQRKIWAPWPIHCEKATAVYLYLYVCVCIYISVLILLC